MELKVTFTITEQRNRFEFAQWIMITYFLSTLQADLSVYPYEVLCTQ